MKTRTYLLGLLVVLLAPGAVAQDIRGGEIHYSHVSGNTYDFEIHLDVMADSQTDRSSIQWNPGSEVPEMWLNGVEGESANGVKRWTYAARYTYPSPGSYVIQVVDSFRVAGIENIPQSQNTVVLLMAELTLSPVAGPNSAAVIQAWPGDISVQNNTVSHNAAAIDPDDDLLEYSLAAVTPGGVLPIGVSVDPQTGLLTMPVLPGRWTVVIRVDEIRNEQVIGSTFRELMIDMDALTAVAEIQTPRPKAFPNPATHSLRLEYEQGIRHYRIFNVSGQQLYTQNGNTQTAIDLDVSALSPGWYLLEVYDAGGERHTLQWVKQ
ncbi:MAG: T9SS C-terminal target domain-containing protein [Cryomorphaceae bacterium]|nr:MAG: T9SS C-terminal target domain-containing protein [Cryomorphaceae bacterium]